MKIRFAMVFGAWLFLVCGASALAQQQVYYLAQVANGQFPGGSLRTTFIAFNIGNEAVTASLVLTRDDGSPLSVTIAGLGSGDRFTLTLEAGATRILQTDGLGTATAGAATVTSTGPIGVSAIFSIFDSQGNFLTEAGVGSAEPLSEFVIPVDSTGTFNTGLALFNFGGGSVTVTLRLLDASGQERGRVTSTLESRTHLARFVSGAGEFFPAVTNFRGSLVVSATGPIAALTLRQNSSPLSNTTLPVIPRASSQLESNLPQVANGPFPGGSFRTSFLVSNISNVEAVATLTLSTDDGSPFSVTIPGAGTGSTFRLTIPAGGSIFLQTDGSGPLTAGSARVISNVPVGVSAIFTIFDAQGRFLTEAGVGNSPLRSEFSIPVDITEQFDTGVAFFNTGAETVTITMRLLDGEGRTVAVQALPPLAGRNKVARFVSELFAGTRNFRGSLSISSSFAVAALTLRQNASPLAFSTLPVTGGASSGRPPQVPPLLAQTRSGVNVIADVTINVTLPPGFRLSGSLSGEGGTTFVVARQSDGQVFIGLPDAARRRYLAIVPAGTFDLLVCHQPPANTAATLATLTYQDPTPVPVPADTVRDVTLPATALFNASGVVSGLGSVGSLLSPSLTFTSTDQRISATAIVNADGTYQGALPNGNYTASLGGAVSPTPLQSQGLSLYNIGSLVVNGGGAANYTVPPTARVAGAIRGPDVSAAVYAVLTASDLTAPAVTAFAGCGFAPVTNSTTAFADPKTYQMVLASGRTHGMSVTVPVSQGSAIVGFLTLPAPARQVAVVADGVQDFDVPAFPARVAISGRVTDSNGNGVAATVSALSTEISGIPASSYNGFTQADASGNYRLVVLSGANYQIIFSPPLPQP